MSTTKRQPFDAHQYAIDGGWSIAEIRRTAADGVAEEDDYRIRDYYGDEDAAENAIQCLEMWCIARVAEEG